MASAPCVPCKPRSLLTVHQVIEIFKQKGSATPASNLADVYGVSEKAVRDIWKGRTWSKQTCHLDPNHTAVLKIAGRPKGRKDSKPRKKRQAATIQHCPKGMALFQNLPSRQTADKSSAYALQKEQAKLISRVQHTKSGKRDPRSKCRQMHAKERFLQLRLSCETRGDLASSCSSCVDGLLSTWNETLWINSQHPDPFRDDWAPTLCPSV